MRTFGADGSSQKEFQWPIFWMLTALSAAARSFRPVLF
jgi:hypothetical protein